VADLLQDPGKGPVRREAVVGRVELRDEGVDRGPRQADGDGGRLELGRIDGDDDLGCPGGDAALDVRFVERRLEGTDVGREGGSRREEDVDSELRGGPAGERTDEAPRPRVESRATGRGVYASWWPSKGPGQPDRSVRTDGASSRTTTPGR
jgi:hypothetical protein